MTFKYKLTAEEHAALSEDHKALYQDSGEDFLLKVEGMPPVEDVTGLRNQLATVLGEKKAEKKRREELEEEQRIAREKGQLQNGEFEQLYTSAQQKLQETEQRLAAMEQGNQRRDIQSAAQRIATALADGDNADILAEFIERRLKVSDGQLKVTDPQGNLTVSTLADLENEFKLAPRYAALVRGTKASGGGAAGSGGGATKTWHEMSGMERVELRRTNPAEHARLKEAASKAK